MARGDSLKRQWSLVQQLQTHRFGLTVDEMAERLGCTRRTIQRDIGVLREVGLPVEHQPAPDNPARRCYTLPHGYLDRSELLLTITEALSLYLAKAMMGPLVGTTIGEAFDQLVQRIEQSLSPKTLQHFRDLRALLLVLPGGWPDLADCREALAAIGTAVRERRVLDITYHTPWRGEQYTTAIHPYGLVVWHTDLYLVAYSCRANDVRVFKVTRIRAAALTNRCFTRPDDFDLEDYFASSLTIMRSGEPFEARVAFMGPGVTLALERRWHPSQRIVERSAERLVLKMTLCDPIGLKQWIKSFGSHARLLGPEWLCHELRDELAAAAALYS